MTLKPELLDLRSRELIPPRPDGRLPGAGALGVGIAVQMILSAMPALEPVLTQGFAALEDIARRHDEHGFVALSYAILYYYGGFFDSLAAASLKLSPLGLYETRHFLNGLFGILSVIGCFSLARLLAGARAGFLALLIICFSPAYYGHMFNNPKDIPFSAFYVWSVYYLVKFYLSMTTIPRSLILKLGVSIGLTLSVRIGGLLLIVYM